MPDYNKCYMTIPQHILTYVIGAIIAGAVVFIFYHNFLISVILGLAIGSYLERMFADSTVRKRKRALRVQFRTFLESMTIATRAGGSPTHAITSALDDLRVSYRDDSDIVLEISNIIERYERGGIALTSLFNDFADRSGLEDIYTFASIYQVIEGKTSSISDILAETSQIIGDKIEIEQEIETAITSAKSENSMMLLMPIIIVLTMTFMGGELLESLFTTIEGRLSATVSLIIFAVSYSLSVKLTSIDV